MCLFVGPSTTKPLPARFILFYCHMHGLWVFLNFARHCKMLLTIAFFFCLTQGEGPFAWFPASGRDISSIRANSSYNHLPQGQQHIGFSPPQASHAPFDGIYHPAQTMASTSPLPQPSKAMARPAEVAEPPSGTYQHPQHAINWNSIC